MYVSASTYIDALVLLLGDNSERTRRLVGEFMNAADKDDKRKSIITSDDDLIDVYKGLIKSVLSDNVSQENTTACKILLIKVKSNEVLKSHPMVRDLLTDILTNVEPISASQIDKCLKALRNALVLAEMEDHNRKVFARTQKASLITDPTEQEEELTRIRTMIDDGVKLVDMRQRDTGNKASETYVSLSEPDSIKRALETYMDRNVRGIIRTGLQGLNRALGDRGGFGLGEMVVFAARSHNYKSGILMDILRWAAVHNKYVVEPGKKALIYFVSLENEVSQNLMNIFKAVYSQTEKKKVNVKEFSIEYITTWLREYFAQFDLEIFIDRYSPHEFTYGKYVQRYNSFIEQNYQMVLFDLDYMSEARGIDAHDTISSQGRIQMIAENYLKFRSHANSQGYLLTTGHQLTKKADELAANDRYAVKKFNASMMADSSDVFRIIDILFFLNIAVNVDGLPFLMFQLRKNRLSMDTLEKDKFFAYMFTEVGIEDDIGGTPKFVTDIDAWSSDSTNSDASISESAMF
jgi:hypothetical protein